MLLLGRRAWTARGGMLNLRSLAGYLSRLPCLSLTHEQKTRLRGVRVAGANHPSRGRPPGARPGVAPAVVAHGRLPASARQPGSRRAVLAEHRDVLAEPVGAVEAHVRHDLVCRPGAGAPLQLSAALHFVWRPGACASSRRAVSGGSAGDCGELVDRHRVSRAMDGTSQARPIPVAPGANERNTSRAHGRK